MANRDGTLRAEQPPALRTRRPPGPAGPAWPTRVVGPTRMVGVVGVVGPLARRWPGWSIPVLARIMVITVVILLTSCAGSPGPVTVNGAPDPTGAQRSACLELGAALPSSLGSGLERREVRPASPFVTAWGSPPAVLSCGVPGVAPGYRPDVTLSVVDDVGWFTEEHGDTVRYSTPTRRPQVVLLLPASVQAFDVLATLAAPIRDATQSTTA
ncbi:hypothetical protein FDG2_5420 [Candidatus Protofrankia californiensis]|uniref:Secreted protein n=1 Tax=Candidatus Protofrankia californiensis TaxID=1839754 RepID=A0A1C3PD56_9ACTN|nr:hypothetical protein FDG2_5420 [Candidatus Protofrankia californiensis]